jgi:hypothetical protein
MQFFRPLEEVMAEKGKGKSSIALNDTPVVHGSSVPTIYVDGAIGVSATAGILKINLFQAVQKFNTDGVSEQEREIVARLVMTPPIMASIGRWLIQNAEEYLEALSKLEQHGTDQDS